MNDEIIREEFNSLYKNHPYYNQGIWKIYGPYQRSDSRRHIIIYDGFNKITISYPKFMMECKLQRLLTETEEVHHKNNLEFDDRLENFELKNKLEHIKEHQTKLEEFFICPVCNTVFGLLGLKLSRMKSERKRKPWTKGPYCSRSCSSKVNN